MRKFTFVGIILTFIFTMFNIAFTVTSDTNLREKSPIHIKSDLMEAEEKTGSVVFSGNVVVTYEDITMFSDKLEVIYNNESKQGKDVIASKDMKRDIEKLIATGNVKITQDKKTITGNKAIYEKKSQKITIIGDAQAWDDKNRIKGDTIIYYIKEKKSVIQGKGQDKVEAIVYPEK